VLTVSVELFAALWFVLVSVVPLTRCLMVVQGASQTKLQEEQKALEMKYILDRTRQEAERQRIEAAGIADFQAIVSKGLTDKLLEWKGIEATEKLAHSPNTKVIIVGSSKNGLPVILNTAGVSGTP